MSTDNFPRSPTLRGKNNRCLPRIETLPLYLASMLLLTKLLTFWYAATFRDFNFMPFCWNLYKYYSHFSFGRGIQVNIRTASNISIFNIYPWPSGILQDGTHAIGGSGEGLRWRKSEMFFLFHFLRTLDWNMFINRELYFCSFHRTCAVSRVWLTVYS
jgi:hypothetical protein